MALNFLFLRPAPTWALHMQSLLSYKSKFDDSWRKMHRKAFFMKWWKSEWRMGWCIERKPQWSWVWEALSVAGFVKLFLRVLQKWIENDVTRKLKRNLLILRWFWDNFSDSKDQKAITFKRTATPAPPRKLNIVWHTSWSPIRLRLYCSQNSIIRLVNLFQNCSVPEVIKTFEFFPCYISIKMQFVLGFSHLCNHKFIWGWKRTSCLIEFSTTENSLPFKAVVIGNLASQISWEQLEWKILESKRRIVQ